MDRNADKLCLTYNRKSMKKLLYKLIRVISYSCMGILGQLLLVGLCFANDDPQAAKSIHQMAIETVYKNASLADVFADIESKTDFVFTFDKKDPFLKERFSKPVGTTTVANLLKDISRTSRLVFQQINNNISVRRQKAEEKAEPPTVMISDAIDVSGRVISSSDGLGIPGVNILVKGTGTGTVTDVDGNYTIDVPNDEDVLVFSSIGYILQEVPVNGRAVIDVTLEEDLQSLDEVVVVGYGTQRKVSTTSPVSQISGDDLVRRPINNVQQTLQGLAPGVTILDQGGYPGRATATVRVRGITTLGNNNPLVLIDGVEQRLDDINPNDIESISILKDAASTAIYGSRAANGVLLVTTKRGSKEEGLNVVYSGYVGLRNKNNNPEHMEVGDYMRLQNIAYTNAGSDPLYTEEQIQNWVTSDDRITHPLANNWFNNKDLIKTGLQIDQNLSVSGGGEKVQGRASLRWQDNEGIVSSVTNEISEARANLDFTPYEVLKLSADLNYRQNYSTAPLSNPFQFMFHAGQWVVPKYPDGTYGLSRQNQSPLVFNDLHGTDKLNRDFLTGNLKLELDLLPGLKFTGQYSLRATNDVQKIFNNAYTIYAYEDKTRIRKEIEKNSLREIRDNSKETTLTTLLNYDYTLDRHVLNLLAGYSEISNQGNYLNGYREFFFNNQVQSISMGSDENKDITGYDSEWGLQSFFTRANYIFADKYIFEVNARWDGSSRFTGSNVYAFFPSVSGAWRITEEDFWNTDNEFLNEFKIRASWGKSGNQAIPLYEFYPALTRAPYAFSNRLVEGYLQTDMANPDLTWETTTQTNIGFDAEFLNHKLTLGMDWYKKRTDGILLQLPIPAVIGLNPPQQNAGIVDNEGFEIEVGYRNRGSRVSYDIAGNVGYNANKIISLAGTGPYINTTSAWTPVYIKEEGYPIDTHYGYQIDGLFQTQEEVDNYPNLFSNTKPGDTKYIDLNNDGQITPDDMTHLGNSFPAYTFGLNSTLTFKNFEFFWHWQGAADFSERIDGALGEFGNQEGFTHKILTDNYWTEDNREARFPRPVKFDLRNVHSSELLVIDASYFRLKMLQIGYNLPASLLANNFLNTAKVTLSGTDLVTFSRLSKDWNLDPEAGSRRGNYYPQTSVYSLGFVFQF
jgi:TonB-linked SusC/RagA family outer membrane protein